MRSLILFLLPLASFSVEVRPYPQCWKACSDENALFTITCPDGSECTCQGSDGTTTDCGQLWIEADPENGIEAVNGITGWKDCQKIAENKGESDSSITHFRWQKHENVDQICYLLKKCDEKPACSGPIPGSTCVSGDKICEEPTPAPDVYIPCPKIEPWDSFGIHWVCENGVNPVNSYVEESPVGTTCQTNKPCKSWSTPDKVVIATCTADIEESGVYQGYWKVDPPVTDTTITEGEANISPEFGDHQCQCADLVFDNKEAISKPGVSYICDNPLDETAETYTQKSGNSCVLICDGHISMIVDCFDGDWKNVFDDTYPDVGKDDIHC